MPKEQQPKGAPVPAGSHDSPNPTDEQKADAKRQQEHDGKVGEVKTAQKDYAEKKQQVEAEQAQKDEEARAKTATEEDEKRRTANLQAKSTGAQPAVPHAPEFPMGNRTTVDSSTTTVDPTSSTLPGRVDPPLPAAMVFPNLPPGAQPNVYSGPAVPVVPASATTSVVPGPAQMAPGTVSQDKPEWVKGQLPRYAEGSVPRFSAQGAHNETDPDQKPAPADPHASSSVK